MDIILYVAIFLLVYFFLTRKGRGRERGRLFGILAAVLITMLIIVILFIIRGMIP
ncbi:MULTISPECIES: hypothetical protein [Bacillaceae]|uniref:hypothetical protein n=1 Tax=Bacillaceae TaxID=186817 RepID=UPI0012E2F396|nr:hypothetical protein [Bacillus sp. FJAT-27916]